MGDCERPSSERAQAASSRASEASRATHPPQTPVYARFSGHSSTARRTDSFPSAPVPRATSRRRHVPRPLPTPPAYDVGDRLRGRHARRGRRLARLLPRSRLEALIEAALLHNRDLAVGRRRASRWRAGSTASRAPTGSPPPWSAAGATRSHSGRERGGVPGRRRRHDRSRVGQRRGDRVRARLLGTRARPHRVGARRLPRHRAGAARVPALADPGRRLDVPRDDRDGGADPARRHHGAEPARGVRIAQVRFRAGLTSALDLHQAESLLAQAEASLAAVRLTQVQLNNQLLRARRRTGGGPAAPAATAHAADDRHRAGARGCPRSCCSRGRTCSRRKSGCAPPRRASARRAPRSFRRSRSPACSGSRRAR